MNRKGVAVFVGIMISMLIFTMLAALVPSIKDQVVQSRSDLGCSGDNLTATEEGTCIVNDGYLFFFVLAVLSVSLSYIGIKSFRAGG